MRLLRMDRPRDDIRVLRIRLIRPLRLSRHSGELPTHDDRANINRDEPRSGTLAPMRVRGGELHLHSRDAVKRAALETGKVPARGDQVRSHALDRVDEHPLALDLDNLALAHDHARRARPRPEAMHDVALGLLEVRPKVRETPLGAFPELPSGDVSGVRDFERELEVVGEVGADGVRFGRGRAGGGFVRDGELVSFAGSLVEVGRRGHEVGDVDGLPCRFLRRRVVDLAGDLNRGVPDTLKRTIIIIHVNRGCLHQSYLGSSQSERDACTCSDLPKCRMNYLEEEERAIFKKMIEHLCFNCKSTWTRPLGVLGLELSEEIRRWVCG